MTARTYAPIRAEQSWRDTNNGQQNATPCLMNTFIYSFQEYSSPCMFLSNPKQHHHHSSHDATRRRRVVVAERPAAPVGPARRWQRADGRAVQPAAAVAPAAFVVALVARRAARAPARPHGRRRRPRRDLHRRDHALCRHRRRHRRWRRPLVPRHRRVVLWLRRRRRGRQVHGGPHLLGRGRHGWLRLQLRSGRPLLHVLRLGHHRRHPAVRRRRRVVVDVDRGRRLRLRRHHRLGRRRSRRCLRRRRWRRRRRPLGRRRLLLLLLVLVLVLALPAAPHWRRRGWPVVRHVLWRRRLAAAAAIGVDDVDVPHHLAALAAELAREPLRVERAHHGDRLALVVEGDGADPLMVCNAIAIAMQCMHTTHERVDDQDD